MQAVSTQIAPQETARLDAARAKRPAKKDHPQTYKTLTHSSATVTIKYSKSGGVEFWCRDTGKTNYKMSRDQVSGVDWDKVNSVETQRFTTWLSHQSFSLFRSSDDLLRITLHTKGYGGHPADKYFDQILQIPTLATQLEHDTPFCYFLQALGINPLKEADSDVGVLESYLEGKSIPDKSKFYIKLLTSPSFGSKTFAKKLLPKPAPTDTPAFSHHSPYSLQGLAVSLPGHLDRMSDRLSLLGISDAGGEAASGACGYDDEYGVGGRGYSSRLRVERTTHRDDACDDELRTARDRVRELERENHSLNERLAAVLQEQACNRDAERALRRNLETLKERLQQQARSRYKKSMVKSGARILLGMVPGIGAPIAEALSFGHDVYNIASFTRSVRSEIDGCLSLLDDLSFTY